MTDKQIFIHNGKRKFLCECGKAIAVSTQTECSKCGIHWKTEVKRV